MALIRLPAPRGQLPAELPRANGKLVARGLKSLYLLDRDHWRINLVDGSLGGSIVGTGVTFPEGWLRTSGTATNGATLAHGLAVNVAAPVTFFVGWRRLSGAGVSWSLLSNNAQWSGWYGEATGDVKTSSANSFDGLLSLGAAGESYAFCHRASNDLYGASATIVAADASSTAVTTMERTLVHLGAAWRTGLDNGAVAQFTHFGAFQGEMPLEELLQYAGRPGLLFEEQSIFLGYSFDAPTTPTVSLDATGGSGTFSGTVSVPATVSLNATGGSGTFSGTVVSTPAYLLKNSAFGTPSSWPTAIFRNGSTYFGWVDNDGAVGVTRYNHDTDTASHFTLRTPFEHNNHDNPSVGFLDDGRLIAFYSKHNDASILRYRITTSTTGDISAWSTEATIATGAENTYAMVFYMAQNSKTYCLFRKGAVGGTSRPITAVSTIDGSTWDATRDWFTDPSHRPYPEAAWNGRDRIDFLWVPDNPGDNSTSVYHCYMQLSATNEELFYKTDGTLIGGGPVTTADCTLVYDGSTNRAWMSDVSYMPDGKPCGTICVWTSATNRVLKFVRWDGTAWIVTDIANEGTTYSGYFFGGAALDAHNPMVCYASMQSGALQEIVELRSSNEGKTWVKHHDISLGSGTFSQGAVSPYSPRNHDGRCASVWHTSDATAYNVWSQSAMYGAPGPRIEIEVRTPAGVLVTNLSGLGYAVFDKGTMGAKNNRRVPLASDDDGRIDANGILHLAAPGASSNAVFVVPTDTEGDPTVEAFSAARPVRVI